MSPKVYIPPHKTTNISDALMFLKIQQLSKTECYTRYYPMILSDRKHYIICFDESVDTYKYKRVKLSPKKNIPYVEHLDTDEHTLRHIIDLMSDSIKIRINKEQIRDQAEQYYFYTLNPLCSERDITKIFY